MFDERQRTEGHLLESTSEAVVAEEWQHSLWNVYSSRLGEAQRKSPFRQHMEEQEFLSCLCDETFLKLVLWEDGKPVGILLLARDISRINWLHAAFFEARYPAAYATHRLFYYAGIAIKSGVSPRGAALLHRLMLREFFRLGGAILFHDYATNVHASSGSLGQFMTRKYGGRATEIDQMHFWCLEAAERTDSYLLARGTLDTGLTDSRTGSA
jgi:hypothetical protein